MTTIKHVLHINAPVENVISKLNTVEGIRNWWTIQTNGNAEKGGKVTFNFGEAYTKVMEVVEETDSEIIWQVIECPHAPEWIGTFIKFELSTNDAKTKVLFTHQGWEEQSEFYAHCNFSWAYYLMSLRDLVEKGKGSPFTPSETLAEN